MIIKNWLFCRNSLSCTLHGKLWI